MNSINYLRTNEDYNTTLEEALSFHSELVGLTTETPTSKTDSIIVKQNNIIILLLLSLHRRISKLENKTEEKPETSKKIRYRYRKLNRKFWKFKIRKKVKYTKIL